MVKRNIVKIDEEKCNGCGQCITACAEGAIELINGKAKLVSEVYCDGLGACIGHCPQDAITIEQGLPYKAFTPDAINILIEYTWPGNVRQLKDTIESLIVLTDSELIVAEDVKSHLNITPSSDHSKKHSLSSQLKQLERTLIIQALVESDYNISTAATLLEIERSNLSKKIKNYGIDIFIHRKDTANKKMTR